MAGASYAEGVTPLYERALRIQQEVLAAAEEARRLDEAYLEGAAERDHERRHTGSPDRGSSGRGKALRQQARRRRSPPHARAGAKPPKSPKVAWGQQHGEGTSERKTGEKRGKQTFATARRSRCSSGGSGGGGSSGGVRSSPRASTRLSSVERMLLQATEGVRAPGAQLSTSLQLLEVAVRRAKACSEYMELASDPNSPEGRLLQRATLRLDALRARAEQRREKRRGGVKHPRSAADCTRLLVHDLKETGRGLSYRPPSAEEVEEATFYRVVCGPAWPESWGIGPHGDGGATLCVSLCLFSVRASNFLLFQSFPQTKLTSSRGTGDAMEDEDLHDLHTETHRETQRHTESYEEDDAENREEAANTWDRLSRSTNAARYRQAPSLSPRAESRCVREKDGECSSPRYTLTVFFSSLAQAIAPAW